MIQRFLIPIQSFSDIITNSSSELFVSRMKKKSNFRVYEIEEILKKIFDEDKEYRDENENNPYSPYKDYEIDEISGMGGSCKVRILSHNEGMGWLTEKQQKQYKDVDQFIVIDVDMKRKRSIDWIKSNLEIISIDHCY